MTRPSLRERAAEILSAAFPDWDIGEEDIHPVRGFWNRQDVYRWEAYFYSKKRYSNGDRVLIGIGCWTTLEVFVRDAKNGIVFEDGEVWANTSPKV